jgi:heat shock protein HslJ
MKRIILTTMILIFITSCGILPNNKAMELSGTNWKLTSYCERTPLSGKEMTAKFTAKEIQGSASCNHYFGAYEVSGDKITIEGLSWTEMACLDPEGIMEQEQTLMNLLSLASGFSINGNHLLISTSDGDVLVFEQLAE